MAIQILTELVHPDGECKLEACWDCNPPIVEKDERLYLGHIEAWRVWLAPRNNISTPILSPIWKTPWFPYEKKEAYDIPSATNYDGIYGVKIRGDITPYTIYYPIKYLPLSGMVFLWGKMIEHEHGYRGQYGYPLGFIADSHPLATEYADLYGVPLLEKL